MRKKFKIVVFALFIVWLVIFSTDLIRASNDSDPVFAIQTGSYDDGGSERFTGLFYMVYHVKNLDIEHGTEDFGYHVTSWFRRIDDVKERVVRQDSKE